MSASGFFSTPKQHMCLIKQPLSIDILNTHSSKMLKQNMKDLCDI